MTTCTSYAPRPLPLEARFEGHYEQSASPIDHVERELQLERSGAGTNGVVACFVTDCAWQHDNARQLVVVNFKLASESYVTGVYSTAAHCVDAVFSLR